MSLLVIVSRDRLNFFSDAPGSFSVAEFLLDRRFEDRRQYVRGLLIRERRRAQRRLRPHLDAQIRSVGFATLQI